MAIRRPVPLVRLVDASPEILDGVLLFHCPVHEGCTEVLVRIAPHPSGIPCWSRTGESFADLTLSPSIKVVQPSECGWHGYIRNGLFETCSDSG